MSWVKSIDENFFINLNTINEIEIVEESDLVKTGKKEERVPKWVVLANNEYTLNEFDKKHKAVQWVEQITK